MYRKKNKNQYLLFRLQNYTKIIKQTLHFELKYVKLRLHIIICQHCTFPKLICITIKNSHYNGIENSVMAV
jgi:hypothetical protein